MKLNRHELTATILATIGAMAIVCAVPKLNAWHGERLKIQAETELANETEWHNQRAQDHIAQFADFEHDAKQD